MSENQWIPVATGVFQRRYGALDVSVVVIEGTHGLMLVDTLSSPGEADALLADVAERFDTPIRWVVNTHAHYDHTFGNQRLGPQSALNAEIFGHAQIERHFAEYEAPRLDAYLVDPGREPNREWHGVVLTPPTHPVADLLRVDLGGREVHLVPLPPAHTDTDLVLFVPDQRVWILGDLVEESGPPMFGSGSFPLDWPGVLASVHEQMEEGDLVVPGHGRVIDRGYVGRQAADLALIAERIVEARTLGLSSVEALASYTDWPFPVDGLRFAFDRVLSPSERHDAEDD